MFKRLKGRKLMTLLGIALITSVLLWGINHRVSAVPPKIYENLKIFTDVISIVEDNYAEDVDPKNLIYGAIKGMLLGLDPH